MIADVELMQMMEDMSKNLYSVLLDSPTQQDKILDKITRIVRNATREQLLSHDPHTLIACILKLILYYENLLYVNGLCEWKRRRKFKTAWYCYHTLLKNYLPEKSREIVKAVIDCVYENRLWKFETFCFEIMSKLLYATGINGTLIIHTIWNKLQLPDINVEDARSIIQMLYELLDVYEWPATQETVMTIEKMLELFHAGIMDTRSTTFNFSVSLTNLKKGLEVCLRNIIKNLSNYHLLVIVQHMCSWIVASSITDEIVLEFSNILEYAAYMHQTGFYEETLTPTIFPLLIQMIGSTSRLTNLLGNRVLQYLLDRRKNRAIFNTPRIFLEHTQYNLRIGPCHKEDRIFLKTHRELLHDGLLKSMVNHSDSRINLETTYCTICLIAIEISSGFTAATLVCLAMNLQEITLQQQQSTHFEIACHMHATVISIMSLICWIHKAKVFYSYVNRIMTERAEWAPHLNPPIQSQYNFAVHHIIWNKPVLFFVDWEARYGLWKCFRLTQ